MSALLIVLLAACSAFEERKQGSRYSDYLADPVSEFRYVNLLEWRPVDEKKVLLRFDQNGITC